MEVYFLNQELGEPNVGPLRFLSRREAINHAIYMDRAYGNTIRFARDTETHNYFVGKQEMPLMVDRLLGRAILVDANSDPTAEAPLKPGGYFSLEDMTAWHLAATA